VYENIVSSKAITYDRKRGKIIVFGVICGDIIGSYYENHCTKNYDFELFQRDSTFTDDTVLTIAVCDTILYNDKPTSGFFNKRIRAREYAERYMQYYNRYPYAGFGQMFSEWARNKEIRKQKSYANGAAMRVVPIAYAYNEMKQVMLQVKCSAEITHAHREAISGAKAIAAACFLALKKCSKDEIKQYLVKYHGLKFKQTLDEIKPSYVFNSRASYCIVPAILAFLESSDYEDAIRQAVSLGGDSDTIAAKTGGIAEAFYGEIPEHIKNKCWSLLDIGIKNTLKKFTEAYCNHKRE